MPVYEIVLRELGVPQKVSFTTRAVTALGDLMIVGDGNWIVVEKEPPFGLRRIERLICEPVHVARGHRNEPSPASATPAFRPRSAWASDARGSRSRG